MALSTCAKSWTRWGSRRSDERNQSCHSSKNRPLCWITRKRAALLVSALEDGRILTMLDLLSGSGEKVMVNTISNPAFPNAFVGFEFQESNDHGFGVKITVVLAREGAGKAACSVEWL